MRKPVDTSIRPTSTPRPGMRFHRFAGVLLLGFLLTGCDFVQQLKSPEIYAARDRLETILNAMVGGDHLSQQHVICLFYKSSKMQCDMDDLEVGTGRFETWLREKYVYRGIEDYEIVDSWQDPGKTNPEFFFHLKINGKNAYIRVQHRGSIQWSRKMEKPAAPGD